MKRERLTITLEPELLQGLDTLVDRSTIRNRSHAIEHVLKEGLGLHQLTQAFLFIQPDWEEAQLRSLLGLCASIHIRQLFICLPAASLTVATEIQTIIAGFALEEPFTSQIVPSDFGTGGAVILQKTSLEQSFLLCWLKADLSLPPSLLSPYLFHRQHGSTLTQLLFSENSTDFSFANLAIAKPELLDFIPAGQVSLEDEVFPHLLKTGRVRGYAITRA